MREIEIDFEVFKELTIRRESENMTYNDVIRDLLGLDESEKSDVIKEKESGDPFVSKSVVFPHGTKFKAEYKGKIYIAEVDNGAIVYNGQRHTSPSSAAIAITDTNVNGWIFWECRRPGESNWTPINKLRERGSQYTVE